MIDNKFSSDRSSVGSAREDARQCHELIALLVQPLLIMEMYDVRSMTTSSSNQ